MTGDRRGGLQKKDIAFLFAETAAVFSLKYPLYLVYHAINKKAIYFTNYRFPSARCGCCFLCRGALLPPYCRENKSERRNRGMRGWAPVVVFFSVQRDGFSESHNKDTPDISQFSLSIRRMMWYNIDITKRGDRRLSAFHNRGFFRESIAAAESR